LHKNLDLITRTEVQFKAFQHKIVYSKPIFLIGSCFADNIKSKLAYHQFSVKANPFGTVYNPVSIANQMSNIILKGNCDLSRIVQRDELFYHLDYHSSFFAKKNDALLLLLNQQIDESHLVLQKSSHIFITLGTAWVYSYQNDHKVVANCQKMPAHLFSKHLLSMEEIVESLQQIIDLISAFNPTAQIFFTVSPVRHTKDGLEENNRSKARLLESIHQVINHVSTHYLPIYEVMMDDLRDYRYYQEDMIHPSDVAIKYIWNKLVDAFMTKETQQLMYLAGKIQAMKLHKPFDKDGASYQSHVQKTEQMQKEWLKSIKTVNEKA
jgi:GSCFA family